MPLSKTLESRPGWKTIEEDLVARDAGAKIGQGGGQKIQKGISIG